MPAGEITFIYTSPAQSQQAQKLEGRKAKSHAAYVAYREHQTRKRPKKHSTTEVDPLRKPENNLVNAQTLKHGNGDEGAAAEDVDSNTNSVRQLVVSSQRRPKLILSFEAFRGLRTDPFMRNPDGDILSSHDSALIDFLACDIGPINATVAWIFNVSNIASGMLEIMAQQNFQNALLCILQEMGDQLRHQSAGPVPSVGVLQHKGRALARVRRSLVEQKAEEVDDATLCAVLLLAVVESRFQNHAVRDLHAKTLSSLTARRGGIQSFPDGSVFKASAMQFDTFWAWETGATMFPGHRRSHAPLYPGNAKSMRTIQALPIGFQNMFELRMLSYDILPVISRAAQFCNFTKSELQEFIQLSRHHRHGFNDFWEACPCLGLDDNKYHPMERLLTMSLMYFAYGAFVPRAFPTGPAGPTPDLTQKLMTYRSSTIAEEECLQWMWILAIHLSWTGTHSSFRDPISMLQLQLRYPDFRAVEAVIALCRKFLWTKNMTNVLHDYWRDLTSDLQLHQDETEADAVPELKNPELSDASGSTKPDSRNRFKFSAFRTQHTSHLAR
jgi:hypothetical protein